MHGEVLHHLVRRGYEAMGNDAQKPVVVEKSLLEMAPLIITILCCTIGLASVSSGSLGLTKCVY